MLITDSKGKLVFTHSYNKGWDNIPEEYRSRQNFETFCYMNWSGLDAESIFLEKIKEYERQNKCRRDI